MSVEEADREMYRSMVGKTIVRAVEIAAEGYNACLEFALDDGRTYVVKSCGCCPPYLEEVT